VGQVWRDPFPLATLLVNVVGSVAMGLLIGLLARLLPAGQNEIRLFVAVGFLGGFTTFSSFSLDAIALLERGAIVAAGIYVAGSVVASVLGLWLALALMRGGAAS